MLYSPKLNSGTPRTKRAEIKDYFNETYALYESLFELLANESAYYIIADRLRHPLIFYYGHTAAFFVNKFKFANIITDRINPIFESQFAIGVDEMSWDDLNQNNYNWPSVTKVQTYRKEVQNLVNSLIDTLPLELPITQSSPWWIILMGIEHENIHLETSSVLIRQLPLEFITPKKEWDTVLEYTPAPRNILLEVEAKNITLGKSKEDSEYGWDNEYGTHQAQIPSFGASKFLVSNGEYLVFVEQNGYQNANLWSANGWSWKKSLNAEMPLFWHKEGPNYLLRTLSSIEPLPLGYPVEVNYYEAEAFCNWLAQKEQKNISLPTEDEYMALLHSVGNYEEITYNSNLSKRFSVPVDRYNVADWYDLRGNVWQWTKTPIYPFDGFEVHPAYNDFTLPTFDGKHNLIKGGSWISRGNVASAKSRYAFRKHFYQFAGFRYVESQYQEKIENYDYQRDQEIARWCHFDWGTNSLGGANFSQITIKKIVDTLQNKTKNKALILGGTTGRSSFELAKEFEEVISIDPSTAHIAQAQKLKDGAQLRYALQDEGELESYHQCRLEDFGLQSLASRVSFWQGDAENLKPTYSKLDLIVVMNTLEYLREPVKFLQNIVHRLNSGGILALVSDYDWKEEQTPKEEWLGGFSKDGERYGTFEALQELLHERFKLIKREDIVKTFQFNKRKYSYTLVELTIWEYLL